MRFERFEIQLFFWKNDESTRLATVTFCFCFVALMARPQARPNFKTADFYAAFAKTLRTAPPPTPAAAAAAAASTSTFPANNPNVSMARAAYIGSDGASSSAVTGPASVSSPRTKVDPPKSSSSSPAASPAKSVGSSSSSSPSTASASNAHLEAEVSSLRAAVQRQIEDIARHRAEAAKRAAELEEIKTAKAELERERANLYKRITVVEKKLERGTHHRDGQKRHDRSQIAIAVRI